MRRLSSLVLLAAIVAGGPRVTWGQADARAAFEAGKQAFQAGQYDKARDQFQLASNTDTKNPEVFLWLGRAQYELGSIDQAIAAWSTVIKFAPNEPYATKMLAVLRGEITNADNAAALIEVLLKEQLHDPALRQAEKALADKALTDAQRAKITIQKSEALIGLNRAQDVPAIVHELTIKLPKVADPAQTTLLLGQAYVRMGGQKAAEGITLLRKVTTGFANSPSAAVAQYELIAVDLGLGATAERVNALAKWIAANPQHALAKAARVRLVDAYLALGAAAGPVKPDAELGQEESAAIQAASELIKQTLFPGEADDLVRRIITAIDVRYVKSRAYAAASSAIDVVLKNPLPRSSRLMSLRAGAGYRTELAIRELSTSIAATGGADLKPDLPKPLADLVALLDAINNEFPADGVWAQQAALAERVRQLGAAVAWPSKPRELKAPLAWAVRIALPVVKSAPDEQAITQAINVLGVVVGEAAQLKEPSARALASGVNTQLFDAISPENPNWLNVANGRVDLMNAIATAEFQENTRTGNIAANAKLGATQQAMLATIEKIISRQAQQSQQAMAKLNIHLQPWMAQGHYALVQDAYAQLEKSMPQPQKKLARLATVRLWIAQSFREHERLIAAGLAPARKLDPILEKAMSELYSLQAGLSEFDPVLVEIRNAWNSIVNHYKGLDYFDVAEQAINVNPAQAAPNAAEYAQLQLASLRRELAFRELQRTLKQYDASKKLALTPAFKTAIDAYQKFISDNPASIFVDQASEAILSIARTFEQYQAFDVAAEVYRSFSAFAAKQKPLSESTPNAASLAERAEFAAASALDAKARAALAKMLAERKPDSPPPAKLSDQFTLAIAAFKDFIKAHPNSPLLGSSIQKIMAVALGYARADAWEVADGVYADLLGANLALKNPERYEFARAMCQIGKGLPEHAVQILSTLTFGSPVPTGAPRSGDETPTPVATGPNAPVGGAGGWGGMGMPGGSGMGGYGGGGFGGRDRAGVAALPDASAAANAPAIQPPATPADDAIRNQADMTTLAAITQQESQRANRVAQIRDQQLKYNAQPAQQALRQAQQAEGQQAPRVPVLSDAEIARLQSAFDAGYKILKSIRDKYPTSITAEQARAEALVLIAHWRTLGQWQRGAALAEAFLKDNPSDALLPQMRLQIARDYLSWAAVPPLRSDSRYTMLAEVARRFDTARGQLASIQKDFPDDKALREQAQWEVANSFLTQARTVDIFSQTLARGQYVRAAKELQRLATQYVDHPNISAIPNLLWQIGGELAGRSYFDEAIVVWTDLVNFDPTSPLAAQAMPQIAATYQNSLNRPLRAVEIYLEVNSARGGGDVNSQNAVFQIGSGLRDQKRWVEALSVLETFVDSFPRHPNAGQALTMIGQIHQSNEAWQDAINAYRRVMKEFSTGAWVQEAKWSIAECTINLSRWREAISLYEDFIAAYSKDPKVPEANRRIGILKDLDRFQALVNEQNQRKAFDAQFQIASILQNQLANPQKAIIEYRKVATHWPQSHLADAALYAIGQIYTSQGEIDKARQTLLSLARQYPDRSLADDALLLVGKSFDEEATRLASLTRGTSVVEQQQKAQRQAYVDVQKAREENRRNMSQKLSSLRSGGKNDLAELEEASQAAGQLAWNNPNFEMAVNKAQQDAEVLTARQLADRQDKINAALRRAVDAYAAAAKVPAGDKAGDALLRMAVIYDEQLKDSDAALATWKEIVTQFSGTAVAEEASWRIAQYHERQGAWKEAVEAYKGFLRNYRRSPRAAQAQFSIAEGYEHLNQWVEAMDAYTNYLNNFADGPQAQKAREQINWIKTYRL